MRTDPQQCHHPSHFLARGKAGELWELLNMLGIPVRRREAGERKTDPLTGRVTGKKNTAHRIAVPESVQHLCNHWQQPTRSNHHWQAVAASNKRRARKNGGKAPRAEKKKEQTSGFGGKAPRVNIRVMRKKEHCQTPHEIFSSRTGVV